jgi:hypothetical protein
LLQDGKLQAAIAVEGEHPNAVKAGLPPHHPLFEAVLRAQRTLVAGRTADRALLAKDDLVIGPLLDRKAPHQVIGMMRIGGRTLDFPADIERKFTPTAAEISRLLCRARPINSPEMAAKS